jgi:hypothetical protein
MQHPALGLVRYQTTEVSDDPDTQVAQVIGMMRDYAISDSTSPEVLRAAQASVQSGDPVQDVWDWVKARMRFVRDEATAEPLQGWYRDPIVETLVRPRDMAVLQGPQGDCDDFSMYGASLLLAKGVPVAFCTVAADPQAPTVFSHVYLVAYPWGCRVPMDLSHGSYPGWETTMALRKQEWPVERFSVWGLVIGAVVGFQVMTHVMRGRR